MRSAPTTAASTSPRAMSRPALESVTTRCGMPSARQLPGRQPRALQERPGLGHPDRLDVPGGERRADDAERRPDPGRRERPRVAVRHQPARLGEQLRAVGGDQLGRPLPPARRAPAPPRAPRTGPAASTWSSAQPRLTAVGPRGAQPGDGGRELAGGRQRGAVRRGDPDRRRAPDRERLDRHGHLLGRRAAQPALLARQQPLVEEQQRPVLEAERLDQPSRDLPQRAGLGIEDEAPDEVARAAAPGSTAGAPG